jgi:hypothetical protein
MSLTVTQHTSLTTMKAKSLTQRRTPDATT